MQRGKTGIREMLASLDNSLFGKGRLNRVVLTILRLTALAVASLHIYDFYDEELFMGFPLLLVIAAGFYTLIKAIQPQEWYRSRAANVFLFSLDISVCASLFILTMEMHSPFLFYTLVPVLTSALVLSGRATLIVAGVTALYVMAGFVFQPFLSLWDVLAVEGEVPTYFFALSLTAALPYTMNSRLKQQLWSGAVKDERRLLAREIHDGVCQSLYGIYLRVQTLSRIPSNSEQLMRELSRLENMVKNAEEEERAVLESLRGSSRKHDLLSQISDYLEQLKLNNGIDYCLNKETDEVELDEVVELELACICQEALRNVQKHSGARKVEVGLQNNESSLQVRIKDDGCGFDNGGKKGHFGLTGMKERAESVGGWLNVTSVPGKGTQVLIEVPKMLPSEEL